MSTSARRTRVAVVLDRSGSMQNIFSKMLVVVKNIVKGLKEKADQGEQVEVAILTFANSPAVLLYPTDARNLTDKFMDTTLNGASVGGSTCLWDATAKAVETIKTAEDDINTSYLVLAFTDGQENCSMMSASTLRKKISEWEATDRYTLSFQVPRGGKGELTSQGISSDNVREWEQTDAGIAEAEKEVKTGTDYYFNARATGARSVRNFYAPVIVNAAKITDKDLNKLDDVSDNFKLYKVVVDKVSVKDFTEGKTRKPYVSGQTYYQLNKPEVVQGTKDVLIIKDGDSTVYSGHKVRQLLGLPTDGTDAKVEPGNFSNKKIFIASTSVNRKLVKNTNVLINTKMKKGLPDTWQKVV